MSPCGGKKADGKIVRGKLAEKSGSRLRQHKEGCENESESKENRISSGNCGKACASCRSAAMIGWAAFSQSNVNGYVLAFFAALVTGVVLQRMKRHTGRRWYTVLASRCLPSLFWR